MIVALVAEVLDQAVVQRHQEIVRARRAVVLLRIEPARRDVGVPGKDHLSRRLDVGHCARRDRSRTELRERGGAAGQDAAPADGVVAATETAKRRHARCCAVSTWTSTPCATELTSVACYGSGRSRAGPAIRPHLAARPDGWSQGPATRVRRHYRAKPRNKRHQIIGGIGRPAVMARQGKSDGRGLSSEHWQLSNSAQLARVQWLTCRINPAHSSITGRTLSAFSDSRLNTTRATPRS